MTEATPLSKMLSDSKTQAVLAVSEVVGSPDHGQEAALKLMLMLTDAGVSQPGSDIGTEAALLHRCGACSASTSRAMPDDRWRRSAESTGVIVKLKLSAPGKAATSIAAQICKGPIFAVADRKCRQLSLATCVRSSAVC